jgi:hypothetical protein
MNSVVQSGNLIPVPPELAQEFGLHEGSSVVWNRSPDGAWTLRPLLTRPEAIQKFRGLLKGAVKKGESGVERFLAWREEERNLDKTG